MLRFASLLSPAHIFFEFVHVPARASPAPSTHSNTHLRILSPIHVPGGFMQPASKVVSQS